MPNIVVWSGGSDSTLVLDTLARHSTKDYPVWAYSVVWDQLDDLKVEQEQKSRKNYLEYAKKHNYFIEHRELRVNSNMGACDLGNAQMLAWIGFLFPYFPSGSDVYFGYIKKDDSWKDFHNLFTVTNLLSEIGSRSIVIKTPLQWKNKYEVLQELKDRHIPSNCIWSCEKPIKKNNKIIACKTCDPCITRKLAKYEAVLRSKNV